METTGSGHRAMPVEMLKEEAGKLLLVKEEIVNAALEKTLAGGDLVQEKIAARFLLKPGRKYEQAAGPKRRTLIFVNNRLEGNAISTIAAMFEHG